MAGATTEFRARRSSRSEHLPTFDSRPRFISIPSPSIRAFAGPITYKLSKEARIGVLDDGHAEEYDQETSAMLPVGHSKSYLRDPTRRGPPTNRCLPHGVQSRKLATPFRFPRPATQARLRCSWPSAWRSIPSRHPRPSTYETRAKTSALHSTGVVQ